MKLAIIVGHTAVSGGAVRVTDNVREWDWNRHLAKLIAAHDPDSVKIFYRISGGGYTREINRVYAEADAWGATATVELHFNSVGTPAAHGTETLTSGTAGSMKLAKLVNDAMVAALGFRDRGLIKRARNERGGLSLWAGRAPAILIEPYFGSNPKECAIADRRKDELAEAIFDSVCAFH